MRTAFYKKYLHIFNLCDIMKIKKGKTSNGYAIIWLFIKITPLGKCGRYFFMANIIDKNNIINTIMYSNPISSHLLSKIRGGDSITAQLLHCFQSYLIGNSDINNYTVFEEKCQVGTVKAA